MISIYQALDAYGEQKVLLLALADLEIIPSVGEELSIWDKEFIVLKVKHVLDTSGGVTHNIELTVVPPDALVEIEYLDEEEEYL